MLWPSSFYARAMANQLRHLAVHVKESKPGDFRWVLTELSADHSWSEIQGAKAGAATYREAMADGLMFLQSMVYDLDKGPRTGVDEATGVGTQGPAPTKRMQRIAEKRSEQASDGERSKETKRSVFGFGLAN